MIKKHLKEIYRIMYLTIRFFTEKRVTAQAAALTYSTLLSMVPILAVVFAIARGFGYNKYIEIWFRQMMSSQPQVADLIVDFVNRYLVHTQSGVFLGVGLLFMLYTVLMLVNNVEETFNEIWRVSNARPLIRSLVNYLAMFFVCPIVILVSRCCPQPFACCSTFPLSCSCRCSSCCSSSICPIRRSSGRAPSSQASSQAEPCTSSSCSTSTRRSG